MLKKNPAASLNCAITENLPRETADITLDRSGFPGPPSCPDQLADWYIDCSLNLWLKCNDRMNLFSFQCRRNHEPSAIS
jgi:hypothetical protein